MSFLATPNMRTVDGMRPICKVDDAMQVHIDEATMRQLLAAAATRVNASSTSAASVCSYSASQIHPRLASSASPRKTKQENSPPWIQKCTVDAMQVYRALREVGADTGGALIPLLPQQASSASPSSTIPFLCITSASPHADRRPHRLCSCSVLRGS